MIKKLLKKLFSKKNNKYVDIDKTSIIGDCFSVRIDVPTDDIRIHIAKDSLINGHYVFESKTGHVNIGSNCHIGNSTFISVNGIDIEDDVMIAWGCTFYDHNSHSIYWDERSNDTQKEILNIRAHRNPICDKDWTNVKSEPIRVCSKAWIGMNCVILKGVTIGENSIVAAGSVVTKDVPPFTMVGGNPAVVIKKIENKNH